MALLVDKHRPRTLDTLSYHPELSERLRSLAASGDFPHLLIYGPSGAGKKTRITATLRALYGAGVEKIKIDSRVFQTTRYAWSSRAFRAFLTPDVQQSQARIQHRLV